MSMMYTFFQPSYFINSLGTRLIDKKKQIPSVASISLLLFVRAGLIVNMIRLSYVACLCLLAVSRFGVCQFVYPTDDSTTGGDSSSTDDSTFGQSSSAGDSATSSTGCPACPVCPTSVISSKVPILIMDLPLTDNYEDKSVIAALYVYQQEYSNYYPSSIAWNKYGGASKTALDLENAVLVSNRYGAYNIPITSSYSKSVWLYIYDQSESSFGAYGSGHLISGSDQSNHGYHQFAITENGIIVNHGQFPGNFQYNNMYTFGFDRFVIPANGWNQIGLSYDAEQDILSLYLNGALNNQATPNFLSNWQGSSGSLLEVGDFMSQQGGSYRPLHGTALKYAKMWNGALSDDAMLEVYNKDLADIGIEATSTTGLGAGSGTPVFVYPSDPVDSSTADASTGLDTSSSGAAEADAVSSTGFNGSSATSFGDSASYTGLGISSSTADASTAFVGDLASTSTDAISSTGIDTSSSGSSTGAGESSTSSTSTSVESTGLNSDASSTGIDAAFVSSTAESSTGSVLDMPVVPVTTPSSSTADSVVTASSGIENPIDASSSGDSKGILGLSADSGSSGSDSTGSSPSLTDFVQQNRATGPDSSTSTPTTANQAGSTSGTGVESGVHATATEYSSSAQDSSSAEPTVQALSSTADQSTSLSSTADRLVSSSSSTADEPLSSSSSSSSSSGSIRQTRSISSSTGAIDLSQQTASGL